MTTATPQLLANQIDRPDPSPDFLAREAKGEISPEQGARYRRFLARVAKEFLTHPVVVDNRYTRWFAAGEATDDELRHFTTQFSVFSNQFLIAQLKKMIASDSIDSTSQGYTYRRSGPISRESTPSGSAPDSRNPWASSRSRRTATTCPVPASSAACPRFSERSRRGSRHRPAQEDTAQAPAGPCPGAP